MSLFGSGGVIFAYERKKVVPTALCFGGWSILGVNLTGVSLSSGSHFDPFSRSKMSKIVIFIFHPHCRRILAPKEQAATGKVSKAAVKATGLQTADYLERETVVLDVGQAADCRGVGAECTSWFDLGCVGGVVVRSQGSSTVIRHFMRIYALNVMRIYALNLMRRYALHLMRRYALHLMRIYA